MFKIDKLLEDSCITIQNAAAKTCAKIDLDKGGSVQNLTLQAKELINTEDLNYKDSYSSAIMFPFASRIDKGVYEFRGKTYRLHKNDENNNCALHGMLYDKAFELKEEKVTKDFTSVTLCYISDGTAKGYPFKYKFTVTYILTNTALTTKVTIKNLDENPFPFSLGWHPYFYSSDLKNSKIAFKSDEQARFNKNLILKDFVAAKKDFDFKISNISLDDCYKLANSNIYFTTPNYKIHLATDNEYLQLFTPKNRKHLAIEPITAPSNSFNNKIGLQVLQSKQLYKTDWKITLID